MGSADAQRSLEPLGALADRAAYAAARSREHLLGLQDEEGFWHFPMEANATMDAQFVFANRLLGRSTADVDRRLGEHLLATQGDDGGWPLFHGGEGHLSCTIEAYFALKLAGFSASEPALRRARDLVLARGGAARAGVFTRIFLAYFGQYPWRGVPALPPELMLLPPRFPLSIYNMSSWARSTLVPLLILTQRRPFCRLAPGEQIPELFVRQPTREDISFAADPQWLSWRNFFLLADVVLRAADRLPARFRQRGLNRALEWMLVRQDRNGGWAGIQPAMVNSVLALVSAGCAIDHPAVEAGIRGLDDFLAEREGHLLFQPCVSPTWDTALCLGALLDSGSSADASHVVRAARWLEASQITRPGDWSVKRPDLEAGGWAFEFANDWYPDVDDSAVILMDLARVGRSGSEVFRRGLAWTVGMQSSSGGYGAFDFDNHNEVLNRIPFADMEAMIDPPTEDLTGRICELMGRLGHAPDQPRLAAARAFLRQTQRADGSWWGRWGVNHIYGTWSVLLGLAAVGADADADMIARGVAFLREHQNTDGGFGESCESYVRPELAGRAASTPSQTAWAAMGLMAGEEGVSPALADAIDYLCRTQARDGSWPEPEFTGTGFPGHFYLRYDGYRCFFPLMALGRFCARVESAER